MFTARSVRRRVNLQKDCRVNIGCGGNPTRGWTNLDVISHPDVCFWDCRSGLPFADGTVTAIYSEHFFEHLDLETEARPFLRECRGVFSLGAFCDLWCPMPGHTCELLAGRGSRWPTCDHYLEFPKWRVVLSISIHVSSAANFSRISKATTGVPNRETIAEQKCAAAQTIAKTSQERRGPPSRELRPDRP